MCACGQWWPSVSIWLEHVNGHFLRPDRVFGRLDEDTVRSAGKPDGTKSNPKHNAPSLLLWGFASKSLQSFATLSPMFAKRTFFPQPRSRMRKVIQKERFSNTRHSAWKNALESLPAFHCQPGQIITAVANVHVRRTGLQWQVHTVGGSQKDLIGDDDVRRKNNLCGSCRSCHCHN